MQNQEGY